jgi:hypothetical protein
VEVAQTVSQAGWCENFIHVVLDANNYYLISVGAGSMVFRSMTGGVNNQTVRHDRMVQLVEQMLDAKQQLAAALTERDKTFYESKCSSLDRQIDELVYELYELTPEEVAIVESAAGQ